MIIKPTVGRIVWFWANAQHKKDTYSQPQAAIVTHVFNDNMVNLCVFDGNGNPHSWTSVLLVQEGYPEPEGICFCEWMPYQIGQAKKHGVEVPPEERERIIKEAQPFRDNVVGE